MIVSLISFSFFSNQVSDFRSFGSNFIPSLKTKQNKTESDAAEVVPENREQAADAWCQTGAAVKRQQHQTAKPASAPKEKV